MELHDYKKTVIPTEGKTGLIGRLWNDEVTKTKRIIKQKLVYNQDIRVLLDDQYFSPYSGQIVEGKSNDYQDYMYRDIFPFLVLPNTLTEKGNYICFKVDDADDNYFEGIRRDNSVMKVVNIQFMVLVHFDNVRMDTGMERHDAIASVIKKLFAWSDNSFPFRLVCTSDVEGVADNAFVIRTLNFEAVYPNNTTDTRRKNAYGN